MYMIELDRSKIGRPADCLGYSLIELMVALIIVGILTPPFLGMMVHFAKANQKSRAILLAGAVAGNQYERCKSLSVPELVRVSAAGRKKEGDFLIETSLERYFPESNADEWNADHLDLSVEDSEDNKFLSCFVAGGLQSLSSLSGSGSLQVILDREDEGISIRMVDANGKFAEYHWITTAEVHVLNIYTQQMRKDREIDIDMDPSLIGTWKITIYEPPFHYGRVSVNCNGQILTTDQQGGQLDFGRGSINVVKAEKKGGVLIYLQVKVYGKARDKSPLSVRQGVIRAAY